MTTIIYTSIFGMNHVSTKKKYKEELDSVFNDWEKINNYTKWQDVQLTIVGRFLLRSALSFYGYDVKNLVFEYTKLGKPYIVNQPIYYNISHSGEIVVCAISYGKIGIDIEKFNHIDIDHFKSFFSLNEFDKIRFSNNKLLAFYNYWTKFESLIKTCEEKFQNNEFIIDNNLALLRGKVYHYKQLNLVENYICTICSEKEIDEIEIIPFNGL